MTQLQSEQIIEAIRKVTAEALKSPETALQFLINAGIVNKNATIEKPKKGKKK